MVCYLVAMKLMMEGQNLSINRTHGSTLVIFSRLWIYTQRSGMRKFEIAQVYYAEDESNSWILLGSLLSPPFARLIAVPNLQARLGNGR